MKRCVRCAAEKSREAFPAHPRTADGLGSWCRECHREYSRRYEREHYVPRPRPEPMPLEERQRRRSIYQRGYLNTPIRRAKHKALRELRKARERGARVAEPVQRSRIFDRDGWTCGLCHVPVDALLRYPDPLSASLDHVVPLSRGGSHSAANVQIAHLRCNRRKYDRVVVAA